MRYRVTKNSYLDGRYYKEGDEVEFNGRPGTSLKPLGPTKKEQAEAEQERREAEAEEQARREAEEAATREAEQSENRDEPNAEV